MYDTGLAYRTKAEVSEWMEKDPITRLGKMLIEGKIAGPKDIESMDKEATKISEDSVEYAKSSSYPSIDEMKTLTYVRNEEQ